MDGINMKSKNAKNRKSGNQSPGKSLAPDELREENNVNRPQKETIERRAYERYIERGGGDGHDLDDWVEAERELLEKREDTHIHSDR